MIDRFARFFLGYDAFVSYSRRDAKEYGNNLTARLQADGVVCFLDNQDLAAGDTLDPSLVQAIRRSRVFLLIATPEAAQSPHVALEMESAGKLRKKMVPVDTGGMRGLDRWGNLNDAIWIDEASGLLDKGRPSDDVLKEIRKRLDHIWRRRLMQGILAAVILGLISLTIWALIERSRAIDERATAEEQREAAEFRRAQAEAQRKIAEKRRLLAQKNLAQAFFEKGDRAWEDRDVAGAEIFFAKSLTLDDQLTTRSRLLETRMIGVSLEWTSPFQPEGFAIDVDGAKLATAHATGPISVYDINTGELLDRLHGHEGRVYALALRGDRILSGGSDGRVKLWNTRTGRVIAEHDAHTGDVLSVLFGESGSYWSLAKDGIAISWQPTSSGPLTMIRTGQALLNAAAICRTRAGDGVVHAVLGSEDGTVALWRSDSTTATSDKVTALKHPIRGVACSADGRRVAAVDSDGLMVVSGTERDTPSSSFTIESRIEVDKGSGLFSAGLIFSQKGQRIAYGGGSHIEVWRWAEPQREARFELDGEYHIVPAFPKDDSRRLFSAGSSLKAWDLRNQRRNDNFPGHGKAVYAVAFRPPEGRILASGGFDHTLRYWDLETQKQLRVVSTGANVLSLAFAPDGQILCSSLWDGLLECRDADTDAVRFSARHPAISPRLEMNPSTGSTMAASGGGRLSAWDLKSGSRLFMIEAEEPFAFAPDGREIASASGKQVRILNAMSGAISQVIPLEFEIEKLAWSPDGQKILAVEKEGQTRRNKRLLLQPISVQTGQPGPLLERTSYEVKELKFCPSSQCFVTTGAQTADLWDSRTGERIASFNPRLSDRDYVVDADFSSNGKVLALATERGSFEVWHLNQRREALTLRGTAERTLSIDADDSGERIALTKTNGAIELWRQGHSAPERMIAIPGKTLRGAVLSPSGHHLAAGSKEGEIHLFDLGSDGKPNVVRIGKDEVPKALFLGEEELLVGVRANDRNAAARWSLVNLKNSAVSSSLPINLSRAVLAVVTDPERTKIALGGMGSQVAIHDLPSFQQSTLIKGHRGTITGIEFVGPHLLTSSRDGTVRFWRLQDEQVDFTYDGFEEDWVEDIAALSEEKVAAISSLGELHFFARDISSKPLHLRLFSSKVSENYSWIKDLEYDPQHRQLWASSGESMEVKGLNLTEIGRTLEAPPSELYEESSGHTGLVVDGTEAVPRRAPTTGGSQD